jgi:secreted trypsin-like serine protease
MTRPRFALRLLVIAAILAMAGQLGVPQTSQAIEWEQLAATWGVHSREVASGPYPFVVAIGYADPSGAFLWDNQFCDGSLVAPDLVLTTAHCVLGTTPEDLAVVVGRTAMASNEGQVRSISGIIVDPSYSLSNAVNDLAVLRLSQPVDGIMPITVIGAGDTTFNVAGTPLTLARWNEERQVSQDQSPTGSPDQMQPTVVHVVDDATCATDWALTGYRDDSVWGLFVCTTPGVFTPGDSGSPLFVATPSGYVQVSLVSGSYEFRQKRKRKKVDPALDQEIPDYGPELSAPSSAQFLASAGV